MKLIKKIKNKLKVCFIYIKSGIISIIKIQNEFSKFIEKERCEISRMKK